MRDLCCPHATSVPCSPSILSGKLDALLGMCQQRTSLQGLYSQLFWHLHLSLLGKCRCQGQGPRHFFTAPCLPWLSPVTAISTCTQGSLFPCQCHGKLSPGSPASLTPVPICPHCLQLCHCLGTGLRGQEGLAWAFKGALWVYGPPDCTSNLHN